MDHVSAPSRKPRAPPPVHRLERHTVHEKVQEVPIAPEPAKVQVVEAHPEQVDPLGKAHPIDPEERRITSILVVALVATFILIPIISAISDSPMLNVFLGLSPLLITLLLDIVATQHHYKPITFWILLAVVHVLALAILWLINILLIVKLNVGNAVSVSLVLGALVTAICWLSNPKESVPRTKHVVAFKPEKLSEYVQSIEDKCKGLNFAIGRVYRNSNGGNAKMRERLRIPSDWYNEFHGIKAEDMKEQEEKATILIRKIRDRLGLYAMKEKDVFTLQELGTLKHIARHKDGEDPVIDVLKTNDRDPVEHYYVSAVEFCDRILEELEKLSKE